MNSLQNAVFTKSDSHAAAGPAGSRGDYEDSTSVKVGKMCSHMRVTPGCILDEDQRTDSVCFAKLWQQRECGKEQT